MFTHVFPDSLSGQFPPTTLAVGNITWAPEQTLVAWFLYIYIQYIIYTYIYRCIYIYIYICTLSSIHHYRGSWPPFGGRNASVRPSKRPTWHLQTSGQSPCSWGLLVSRVEFSWLKIGIFRFVSFFLGGAVAMFCKDINYSILGWFNLNESQTRLWYPGWVYTHIVRFG